MENKLKTHQKIETKTNQLLLHYHPLNVNYIVELNPNVVNNQVEITFEFEPNNKLTTEEKDMIATETREEMAKTFALGEADESSNIEGL